MLSIYIFVEFGVSNYVALCLDKTLFHGGTDVLGILQKKKFSIDSGSAAMCWFYSNPCAHPETTAQK